MKEKCTWNEKLLACFYIVIDGMLGHAEFIFFVCHGNSMFVSTLGCLTYKAISKMW
jgi:hypothetical protein